MEIKRIEPEEGVAGASRIPVTIYGCGFLDPVIVRFVKDAENKKTEEVDNEYIKVERYPSPVTSGTRKIELLVSIIDLTTPSSSNRVHVTNGNGEAKTSEVRFAVRAKAEEPRKYPRG